MKLFVLNPGAWCVTSGDQTYWSVLVVANLLGIDHKLLRSRVSNRGNGASESISITDTMMYDLRQAGCGRGKGRKLYSEGAICTALRGWPAFAIVEFNAHALDILGSETPREPEPTPVIDNGRIYDVVQELVMKVAKLERIIEGDRRGTNHAIQPNGTVPSAGHTVRAATRSSGIPSVRS